MAARKNRLAKGKTKVPKAANPITKNENGEVHADCRRRGQSERGLTR